MPDVNESTPNQTSAVPDAITRWRNRLSAEEAVTPPVLDELTDHLEAELKQVPATGLTEEERVLVAARRVGAPDVLGKQFFALRPESVWARRLYIALLGYLIIGLIPPIADFTQILFPMFLNAAMGTDNLMFYGLGPISFAAYASVWFAGLGLGWLAITRPRLRDWLRTRIADRPGVVLFVAVALTAALPYGWDGLIAWAYGGELVMNPRQNPWHFLTESMRSLIGPAIVALMSWLLLRTRTQKRPV